MALETDPRIVISATACRFADADSPEALWANVLEGRRSFRAIPPARLDLSAYDKTVVGEVDSITPVLAGLLTNWTFDREWFQIPKQTFVSTDLSHWLALELAAEAIKSIGGVGRLPKERTAVIVANTLTGEFSRASTMRMRLPFFENLLALALEEAAVDDLTMHMTQTRFSQLVRQRLTEPSEDTLAGSLANTIAGRIANFFDLRGGAYSVDGACSSSLLAISNGASLIETGQADAVLVGAVDLSLDPFELVGFSRNGALARRRMCVFDKNSNGFWPGEGGAVALLVRAGTAVRHGIPIRAFLSGWGMSTDGAGGLTRPTIDGQLLACKRAYEKAAIDPSAVAYIEAHGTGTAIGDPVEVRALAKLREDARNPLPIGSIKANIGHTKAAAGMAGLIKAIAVLETEVIPPHVGCEVPHACFRETGDKLYPQSSATPTKEGPPIVGVSSFGFGGINVHVVLEQAARKFQSGGPPGPPHRPLARDCEVFLFSAIDRDGLRRSLVACNSVAEGLSLAELGDLAGKLAYQKDVSHPWRLGFAAESALEFRQKIQQALLAVETLAVGSSNGIHLSINQAKKRIAFLFPGQAAPIRPIAGMWAGRFPELSREEQSLSVEEGNTQTANAQTAIVQASLTTFRLLEKLGVGASVAAGHSVGELAALAWGGALADEDAISLAVKRGDIMGRHGKPGGGMVRLQGSYQQAVAIAVASGCEIACRNGIDEFVLAGPRQSISAAIGQGRKHEVELSSLNVSHAFHSHAMDDASLVFAKFMEGVHLHEPTGRIISSVSGSCITSASEAKALLAEQLTSPVLFDAVLQSLRHSADIVIDIGPGAGLSRLSSRAGFVSVGVDGFGETLTPLMDALSMLHASGCDIHAKLLYPTGSFRAVELSDRKAFLSNPCGFEIQDIVRPAPDCHDDNCDRVVEHTGPVAPGNASFVDIVRECVAREADLDANSISEDAKFLSDLHLNSLTVSRIALRAAQQCGAVRLSNPTEFADTTPRILARALEELLAFPADAPPERIAGAAQWVAAYTVTFEAVELPASNPPKVAWDMEDGNDCRILRILGPFDTMAAHQLVADLQIAERSKVARIAILHAGAPISGFCRSIILEHVFSTLVLIDIKSASINDPRIRRILDNASPGVSEFRLTEHALETALFRSRALTSSNLPFRASAEVILAIGCAKGIGFDCLTSFVGAGQKIVFVGRTAGNEKEVQAILENARHMDLDCEYIQADVTQTAEVRRLKQQLECAGMRANMLLYAPAINQPTPFSRIDPGVLEATLGPKVAGLGNVLQAFGGDLSHIIVFGSIIGRLGLEGEAHYALANAMQSSLLEEFSTATPDCKCLSIEWTVWGAGGMGERLGTIERLEALGIEPVSVSDARRVFCDLVTRGVSGTVCLTSRFGRAPASFIGRSEIPFLRFVDTVLLDYPGVEIVAETKVSHGSDPYLGDHVIDGIAVFPGVMALEAMAQVAVCLTGGERPAQVSNVKFMRAISITSGSSRRLRIAVCRLWSGHVKAAIFADDDAFAVPFASAVFSAHESPIHPAAPATATFLPSVAALYGSLFFAKGRFQRVATIDALSSRFIAASMRAEEKRPWFGAFLPQGISLWDPGAADALLHVLQATVPGHRVVPTGIEIIQVLSLVPPVRLVARENWAREKEFSFDIWGIGQSDETVLYFGDARFRGIAPHNWCAAVDADLDLLGPVIERMVRESISGEDTSATLFLCPNMDRAQRRKRALERIGIDYQIGHGCDGRPLLKEPDGHVGLAHCGDMTLAVRSRQLVACDIEALHEADGRHGDAPTLEWAVSEVSRKLDHGRTALSRSVREKFDAPLRLGDQIFHLKFSSRGKQYVLAVGIRSPEILTSLQRSAVAQP
ncbi:SDR family NAD(P)-dependent oxidoreductase (plasmid) [Rhizobium leguminosarum]